MKEQNPIDQYFREQLQDAEVKPSADLWSKIEPRMEDRRANRRGWIIGIAASIAFAFTITAWMYDSYQIQPSGGEIVTDPIPTNVVVPPVIDSVDEAENAPLDSIEEEIDPSSIANETERVQTPSSRMPRVVGHDAGQSARRQNALNSDGENRTYAMAENQTSDSENLNSQSENRQSETVNSAPAKPDFQVKIDPYEYLAARNAQRASAETTPTEQENERMSLDQYALGQIDNLINGKELEAPKKENIRWPEMSINLSPIIQKFSPLLDNTTTQQ